MFSDKINFKLLNLLILSIMFYICINTVSWWGGIISKLISIISPFVIAFIIAYSIYPVIKKLQQKGINKNLAISIVIIFIFILLFGLVLIIIPILYDQMITLSKLIIQVFSRISLRFSINLADFEDSIMIIVNNIITKMGYCISNGTLNIVNKSIDFITKFIVVFILSIYFLSSMENIRNSCKLFLKSKNMMLYSYIQTIDKELIQYLLGLLIFIIIQLFEYCILFFIIGHPNWLLLGILASITTVVPYFGGLITNIIAVILASAVSYKVFIATVIICIVFPNIDSYVISPKIYGKTNNISPIFTIFSLIACGVIFGFIGILLALPIYIIIQRTYYFFKDDIKDKIYDIKTSKKSRKIK